MFWKVGLNSLGNSTNFMGKEMKPTTSQVGIKGDATLKLLDKKKFIGKITKLVYLPK